MRFNVGSSRLIAFILVALIVFPSLAQSRRYRVVIGIKTPTAGLSDALRKLRDSGAFKKLPGLVDQFAIAPPHLKAMVGTGDLAICELKNGSDNQYTQVVWRAPTGDPQAAVDRLRFDLDSINPRRLAARLPAQAGIPANFDGGGSYVNSKDGSVLVDVPAGEFYMGARSDSRVGDTIEVPGRKVLLGRFQISKYEVTNAQYARFVHATGHISSHKYKNRREEEARAWGPKAPVVYITWEDASAYCKWAGLRLPREEEWERAARGTDGRLYPWGDTWDASLAVCMSSSGGFAPPIGNGLGPETVGHRPGGRSPVGCLDMAGNVEEWTGSDGGNGHKVIRGGSWSDMGYAKRAPTSVLPFRCYTRKSGSADFVSDKCLGFRCARDFP